MQENTPLSQNTSVKDDSLDLRISKARIVKVSLLAGTAFAVLFYPSIILFLWMFNFETVSYTEMLLHLGLFLGGFFVPLLGFGGSIYILLQKTCNVEEQSGLLVEMMSNVLVHQGDPPPSNFQGSVDIEKDDEIVAQTGVSYHKSIINHGGRLVITKKGIAFIPHLGKERLFIPYRNVVNAYSRRNSLKYILRGIFMAIGSFVVIETEEKTYIFSSYVSKKIADYVADRIKRA